MPQERLNVYSYSKQQGERELVKLVKRIDKLKQEIENLTHHLHDILEEKHKKLNADVERKRALEDFIRNL